jgi:hypothetical protein
MGEMRNEYNILVGKPEGKRPLGRSRHGWGNNVRVDLCERGWEGVDWLLLAQDRDQWRTLVDTVMDHQVP